GVLHKHRHILVDLTNTPGLTDQQFRVDWTNDNSSAWFRLRVAMVRLQIIRACIRRIVTCNYRRTLIDKLHHLAELRRALTESAQGRHKEEIEFLRAGVAAIAVLRVNVYRHNVPIVSFGAPKKPVLTYTFTRRMERVDS